MTKSVGELIASGQQAMERNDWGEAYDLLHEAAATDGLDPEEFEDLARSAWWSGHPDECIDARERAYAGFIKSDEPQRAALVALDLSQDQFHKNAAAIGHGWVKRAERLLAEEPESVEHGWLARARAVIAENDDELDSGHELATSALELGTKYGDPNLQAISLHDLGRITVARGNVEEGMALMDEAMVAAIGGELDALYTGKIYCNMIDICEQLADYRRAGEWSDAAQRWCERAGHSSGFPGVCRIHRAEIMRLRGDWSAAEEEAEKASHELGNFADFAGEAFYEIGEIRLHMGDYERAEEAFRQAHGTGRDPEPGMAELHLARGNPARAWTLISESLTDASAPLKRARLLPAAIEIALATDDVDSARDAVTELASIAEEYGSPALVAHANHGQGAVLMSDGNSEQAVSHLRRAIELWRENDFPYLAAKSRMVLAETYRRQGSLDSAELEFETARTAFEELGAMADARAAIHALKAPEYDTARGGRTTTALMFTDIVDSTALIGVIGDEAWEQLLRWHHRTLRSLFASHAGREVENTGDGFFAAFDDAQDSVSCAVEIQRTFASQRTEHGFAPQIRIGLHVGEVTEIGATLAGEDVHKAARICGHGVAGEILASLDVVGIVDPPFTPSEPRRIELKGFTDEAEVVTLPWE